MSLLIFNKGGDFDITATATTGTDFVVTISAGAKSESYTTAGAASAAATATAFVAAHAQDIADTFKMYLSNSSAVLTFEGVRDCGFAVSGGTLGSADVTTELSVDVDQVAQILVASATSLTVNMNANVLPSASDVGTLTFVSAADRKAFMDKFNAAKFASKNGAGMVDLDLACKAVFA